MGAEIELEKTIDHLVGKTYLVHNVMVIPDYVGTHQWQANELNIVCIYLKEVMDDLGEIVAQKKFFISSFNPSSSITIGERTLQLGKSEITCKNLCTLNENIEKTKKRKRLPAAIS